MKQLRYGARGTAVKQCQLALYRAGFAVKLDGVYGKGTDLAVRQLQQKLHQKTDGTIGRAEWQWLCRHLKGYTAHTIQKGETMWQIARDYGTSIKRVLTANPTMAPSALPVGKSLILPFDYPLVPTNLPVSSALCDHIVQGLVARYPFLQHGVVGKSVMGKDIWYLEMGLGNRPLCYHAAHHANEWITTPLLLRFLEQYCEAFAAAKSLHGIDPAPLFCANRLYIVPMVNPDGVDLATGMLTKGPFYRKATQIAAHYPSIPFPEGWKANILGTDLNLQYPAGWEEARHNKFERGFLTAAPRDYVGTGPLSAPESLAMARFTHQKKFALTLSYHSQGKVIYDRYLDCRPHPTETFSNYFETVSGYRAEKTPSSAGFAGYKDWFIEQFGNPGFTVEVGEGQNPLPLSQFDDIYKANCGILLGAMTQW